MSRTFPDFPGHFDGDPLVPGGALLAWVQAAAPGLGALDRVRFTAPLRPGQPAVLELYLDEDRLQFEISGPDGLCARGSGRLRPRDVG